MTLPANVDYGTVEMDLTDILGTPAIGAALFTAKPTSIKDAGATPRPVGIMPKAKQISFDDDGHLLGNLVSTEDSDLDPSGWTYHVDFQISNGSWPSFDFHLPAGTTLNLVTATPSAAFAGNAPGGVLVGIGVNTARVLTAAAMAATTPTPGAGILYIVSG